MIDDVDDSGKAGCDEGNVLERTREHRGNSCRLVLAKFVPRTMAMFSEIGIEPRVSATFFVSRQCLEADSVACPKGRSAGEGGWVRP